MNVTIMTSNKKFKKDFTEVSASKTIPRVGEHISIFYQPSPRITGIIWSEDLSNVVIILD